MVTDTPQKPVKYKWGQHPNSKKNLKPFLPGHPNANLKGYSLTALLKDNLHKSHKPPGKKASVGERLIYSTIEGALKREPTPFKEVWDRVDGRLQDILPSVSIDNRQVNIFVLDKETQELLGRVGERTGKLVELPKGGDA